MKIERVLVNEVVVRGVEEMEKPGTDKEPQAHYQEELRLQLLTSRHRYSSKTVLLRLPNELLLIEYTSRL